MLSLPLPCFILAAPGRPSLMCLPHRFLPPYLMPLLLPFLLSSAPRLHSAPISQARYTIFHKSNVPPDDTVTDNKPLILCWIKLRDVQHFNVAFAIIGRHRNVHPKSVRSLY